MVQGTTCTYFSGENGEEKGKVSSGPSDGDSLFTCLASTVTPPAASGSKGGRLKASCTVVFHALGMAGRLVPD